MARNERVHEKDRLRLEAAPELSFETSSSEYIQISDLRMSLESDKLYVDSCRTSDTLRKKQRIHCRVGDRDVQSSQGLLPHQARDLDCRCPPRDFIMKV